MKDFLFFIKKDELDDKTVTIKKGHLHKIKNVLRYKEGDEITFALPRNKDEEGRRLLSRIVSIDENGLKADVISESKTRAASLFTTLYLSLIKSKHFETAIKKATELGVNGIVPLNAKRSVVRINKSDEKRKRERWEAILLEAACQSKRPDIPFISDIVEIPDIKRINDASDIRIVCETRGGLNIKEYLKTKERPFSVSAAVGPEGGFTDEEIGELNRLGFESVTLSENILRAETVPVYLMSILQYEFSRYDKD